MQEIVLAQASFAAETAQTVCGDNPGVFCQWVLEATSSEGLATLAGRVLPVVLRIILVLVIAFVLSRLAKSISRRVILRAAEGGSEALRALKRRSATSREQAEAASAPEPALVHPDRVAQRARTVASVVSSIVVFVVWAVAAMTALSAVGLDIGPLIAGAGIAGVAIGFGAQSLVRDFLSGMFMLLEDQFGIGDIIDVGDARGTVEAINLRVTRLRDVEGTVWHVPNGEIKRVGNMSQLWSRSLLDISVGYDAELQHAEGVIKQVAHELYTDPEWAPVILEEPELWGVEKFGPSEIVLRLVMKTRPAEQFKVNREFRKRLKAAFDEAGLEIPYPHSTMSITQGSIKDGSIKAGLPSAQPGNDSERQESNP